MDTDQRPESRLPVMVFGVIVALPILYVLSVGPVAKGIELATGNKSPPQWARDFYAPLRWLHDNTPLATPLEWYVSLWGVR
jgi:hypothetical protein